MQGDSHPQGSHPRHKSCHACQTPTLPQSDTLYAGYVLGHWRPKSASQRPDSAAGAPHNNRRSAATCMPHREKQSAQARFPAAPPAEPVKSAAVAGADEPAGGWLGKAGSCEAGSCNGATPLTDAERTMAAAVSLPATHQYYVLLHCRL